MRRTRSRAPKEEPGPDGDEVECDLLKEPSDCLKIETVSKEIERYKDLDILQKPVGIYLEHCKQYASEYLGGRTIRIGDYQFTRRDMNTHILSSHFSDILKIQDAELKGLSDQDIASQFSTDTIKLFTDILYNGSEHVLMVKSWQKISFNCKLQMSNKADNLQRLLVKNKSHV